LCKGNALGRHITPSSKAPPDPLEDIKYGFIKINLEIIEKTLIDQE